MDYSRNQNLIRAMANGTSVQVAGPNNTAELVQAVVASQVPVETVQVNAPTVFDTISTSAAMVGQDACYQFGFTNGVGKTVPIAISGYLGEPGDYLALPTSFGPSAVDFAAFLEDQNGVFPANAGALKALNKMLTVGSHIVSKIRIQTTSAAQSSQRAEYGYVNRNFEKISVKRCTPFCDACFNNNVALFTRDLVGPFMFAGTNFLYYPVLDGVSITMQIDVVAVADAQGYTAIG